MWGYTAGTQLQAPQGQPSMKDACYLSFVSLTRPCEVQGLRTSWDDTRHICADWKGPSCPVPGGLPEVRPSLGCTAGWWH